MAESADDLAHIRNLLEGTQKAKFGRYQIFERIGSGGMGRVYKAYDSKLDRMIALKVLMAHLEADEKEIHYLLKEAKAVAQLKHPNIVTVFDFGSEGTRHYIAMEYINGISLKEHMQQQTSSFSWSIQVVAKIACGLHQAHKQGIIHRDIKPANIMLMAEEPKITDFGVAKLPDSSSTATGDVIGTLAYMSPEQVSGKSKDVDRRSDIYGMGILLYELLVGTPPFTGRPVDIAMKILNDAAIFPEKSEIPKELQNICLKCLEKKPKARYQSAKSFATELQAFLQQKPVTSYSKSPWYRFSKWQKRNSALFVSTILLAITMFLGFFSSNYFYSKYLQEKRKSKKKVSFGKKSTDNIHQKLSHLLSWPIPFQNTSFINRKFEKLALEFPNNADLYREWGHTLYKHSFHQKSNEKRSIFLYSALTKFEKAYILAPQDNLSLFLSYLACLRHPNEKIKQNRLRYLEKITTPSDLFKESAAIILEFNRTPKRLQKLLEKCEKTLANFHPAFIPLYEIKTKILIKSQQWSKALICCNKALFLVPKNPYLRELRAKIYLKMKKWMDALEDFAKLQQLNSQYPGCYYGKSKAWKNLKRFEQALENINKALELGHPKKACLLLRQDLYVKLKKYQHALSDSNLLIGLDAKNSAYFIKRAQVYNHLENFSNALKDYQQVLKINSRHKQANEAKKNLLIKIKQQKGQ